MTSTADTVDTSPGDGLCLDAEGHCSLRAAIQETNALSGADAIVLGAGEFVLTRAGAGEDASATGDLDVNDDLALVGAGADATIVDAGALDRVLDLHGGAPRTVGLTRLSLRNGWIGDITLGSGAGLRVDAGVDVTLSHVDVRDNRIGEAHVAVGIDNRGCLRADHVRIVGNIDPAAVGSRVARAGGIETQGTGSCLLLEDSEISGNHGALAGAIHVTAGASMTARRTLFADNSARFAGALELASGAGVLLEAVTISGNAGDPGAILNDDATQLVIVDSTITGNHASGAIANVGGIHDAHSASGRTELTNSIVYGNGPGWRADDCLNARSGGGGNVIGDAAHCHYQAGDGDQLDVDPGLGPLADNGGFTRTHLPGPNAIDRGAATCGATDQRGMQRPRDGDDDGQSACDAGAVEVGDADVLFIDGFDGAATSSSPRARATRSAVQPRAADRRTQGT